VGGCCVPTVLPSQPAFDDGPERFAHVLGVHALHLLLDPGEEFGGCPKGQVAAFRWFGLGAGHGARAKQFDVYAVNSVPTETFRLQRFVV
jgi:hypothetical protein